MKPHFRSLWLRGILLVLGLSLAGSAKAQGITQTQADSILSELRQIRQLLEQMAKTNPAPAAAAPAPAALVKLAEGNAYSLGPPDAPVTLVEFTDYECPFCARFHLDTFVQLKKDYIDTGKVRFVTRDLPLQIHAHALPAAYAARCAGDQGKFWEMRHVLIANAPKLADDAIQKYAQELPLEMSAFQTCLQTGKFKEQIQKDIAEASAVEISGTPTFVIGKTSRDNFEGAKIVGAQPYAVFDAKIKELLPATQ